MNISNYYWYFSGVLTPRFCDEVINMLMNKKKLLLEQVDMVIENSKQEVLDLKRKRKSDLVWQMILGYKRITSYVHEANRLLVGTLIGIDQSLVNLQNIN